MLTAVRGSVQSVTPRKQMNRAWKEQRREIVIARFQDSLSRLYFEAQPEADITSILAGKSVEEGESLRIVDKTFSALDEEIQSRHFVQLAQLLLDHQFLPGPLHPIIGLNEVKQLVLLLNRQAAGLRLQQGQVKRLLIAIQDRLQKEMDPLGLTVSEELFPEWLTALRWGERQINISQVHDSLNLKEATAQTFFFHFGNYRPVFIQHIKVRSWEEGVKDSFAKTLEGGSVMTGEQFVAVVGALVRNTDFYNHRIYSNLTFYEEQSLKLFGKTLRRAAQSIHLSPDDRYRLRLYLERFALGLSAATRFTGRHLNLKGVTCTSRQEFQWCLLSVEGLEAEKFALALEDIAATKHPESPVHPYITDVIRSLFEKKWGA